MSQNAELTVNPNVLRMLGRKLYSSHPLVICTRELLQNSIDACNAKKSAKTDIKIEITTEYIDDNEITTLICTDNGIGMSKDVLLNAFLCLGSSDKRGDNSNTGGFGIAKAALMSNKYWSVHTKQWFVDSESIGKPLQKVEKINGTIVTCVIDESLNWDSIRESINMIYLSDVKISLKVILNGTISLNDNAAGLTQKIVLDDSGEDYKISLLDVLKIPDQHEVKGKNIYRLNGLVQFLTYASDREVNAVIDITTDLIPTDNNYPLSMSRETLSYDMQKSISEVLQRYNIDSESTRNRLYCNEDTNQKRKNANKGLKISGMHTDFEDLAVITNGKVPAVGKLNFLSVHTDKKPNTTEKRILRLWAGILAIMADSSDIFGVGITGLESMGAARYTEDGNTYYVLNIGFVMQDINTGKITSMDGLIHSLAFLASHELAHYWQSTHNEKFTSRHYSVYNDMIREVLNRMPYLRTIIRNLDMFE